MTRTLVYSMYIFKEAKQTEAIFLKKINLFIYDESHGDRISKVKFNWEKNNNNNNDNKIIKTTEKLRKTWANI